MNNGPVSCCISTHTHGFTPTVTTNKLKKYQATLIKWKHRRKMKEKRLSHVIQVWFDCNTGPLNNCHKENWLIQFKHIYPTLNLNVILGIHFYGQEGKVTENSGKSGLQGGLKCDLSVYPKVKYVASTQSSKWRVGSA